MSGRWWRAYERSRNDPKLLKLSDKDFRGWYNVVCTASAYGGQLPPIPDLAIEIRRSEEATDSLLKRLQAVKLLDEKDGRLTPHNWNGLQYKSDVSNERVKRYRQRQCNVTETPSENREQRTDTAPNGAGAKAPARDVIFAECLPWLMTKLGKDRSACAKIVGHWLSTTRDDDEAVLLAMRRAEETNAAEPVGFVTRLLKPADKYAERDREVQEAIERSKLQ